MIENDVLRLALLSAVKTQTKIDIFAPTEMISSQRDSAGVSVSLSDGQRLTSSLLVAADGRNSVLRKSAGIDVSRQSYDQKALVLSLIHI